LSDQEFEAWIGGELPEGLEPQRRAALARAIRPNIEFPSDARVWADVVLAHLPDLSDEATNTIRDAGVAFFEAAQTTFAQTDLELKAIIRELGQVTKRKGPSLFMPLRAALTGHTH